MYTHARTHIGCMCLCVYGCVCKYLSLYPPKRICCIIKHISMFNLILLSIFSNSTLNEVYFYCINLQILRQWLYFLYFFRFSYNYWILQLLISYCLKSIDLIICYVKPSYVIGSTRCKLQGLVSTGFLSALCFPYTFPILSHHRNKK